MATTTAKKPFWDGVKQGLPFMIVVVPFAMLFGVLGSEAGLTFAQVATALTVNLRMAMYSAALAPHLGKAPWWQRGLVAYLLVDHSYTLGQTYYEDNPQLSVPQRFAFFIGIVGPVVPTWYLGTVAGVLVGQGIPPEYALDFAVPIAFIAAIAPAFRTIAHVAAALVAISASLALAWIPYSGGVMVAAVIAMMVGAEVERRFLEPRS